MSKAKVVAVIGLLALGLAVIWRQQQALTAARSEVARLKQQLSHAEQSISRNAAHAANPSPTPLSTEQFNELMRLRGEVSQLRTRLGETESRLANAHNAQRANTTAPAENPAATDAAEPAVIPRENWAWAGYATPEAAFTTVLWAMSKGDLQSLLASSTPEAKQALEREFAGKSPAEATEALQQQIAGLQAIRLDRKKSASDDKVTFTLVSREEDNGLQRTREEAVMTFIKSPTGGAWLYQP